MIHEITINNASPPFVLFRVGFVDRFLAPFTLAQLTGIYYLRNAASLTTVSIKMINPETLGFPRGYSHGVLVDSPGRLLFVSGQVGWDETQQIVSGDFSAQFDRALANVIAVVTEAGGSAEKIVRMTIYVTDAEEYRAATTQVGERYRNRMGKHFSAMVLVEVNALLERDAKVEIEAIAVL